MILILMVMGGDFHEERCCEWSEMHSGTPDWVLDIIIVILRVILRVILVIFMMKRVIRGDFYEERCCKCAAQWDHRLGLGL